MVDISRFSGKVAIITGGGRGIGAKTAEMFTEQGGKVLIGDTNAKQAKELAEKIGKDAGWLEMDVTDPKSCQEAVDVALDKFGSVDCVVNSAIKMAPGALKDLSLEDWNMVINVGLTGTFLMCQAAGRWMIDNNVRGSMVNISSTGGRAPYGMAGAYSTVKAAILMLSQHFAIEWANHWIRVNAVCPGHTETPLTAYLQDPEIKKGRADVTPLHRVGQPEDIANGILFLLSDEADYVTASALDIDGGLTKSVMNHMPGRKWD